MIRTVHVPKSKRQISTTQRHIQMIHFLKLGSSGPFEASFHPARIVVSTVPQSGMLVRNRTNMRQPQSEESPLFGSLARPTPTTSICSKIHGVRRTFRTRSYGNEGKVALELRCQLGAKGKVRMHGCAAGGIICTVARGFRSIHVRYVDASDHQ